ncbi:hypothetical protein ABIE12_000312 [Serratia sp. 509]
MALSTPAKHRQGNIGNSALLPTLSRAITRAKPVTMTMQARTTSETSTPAAPLHHRAVATVMTTRNDPHHPTSPRKNRPNQLPLPPCSLRVLHAGSPNNITPVKDTVSPNHNKYAIMLTTSPITTTMSQFPVSPIHRCGIRHIRGRTKQSVRKSR